MRRVVLTPGTESSAFGVSLTALTERVHSDGAIRPGRKCFLLMKDWLAPRLRSHTGAPQGHAPAKNISLQAEWLRQSGCAP